MPSKGSITVNFSVLSWSSWTVCIGPRINPFTFSWFRLSSLFSIPVKREGDRENMNKISRTDHTVPNHSPMLNLYPLTSYYNRVHTYETLQMFLLLITDIRPRTFNGWKIVKTFSWVWLYTVLLSFIAITQHKKTTPEQAIIFDERSRLWTISQFQHVISSMWVTRHWQVSQ